MKARSVFDVSHIRNEFDSAGINHKFIPIIWKYVIENPNCDWDEIPSLPSAAYQLLNSNFKPCTSVVHSVFNSTDQVTTKLLMQLQNGEFVEAVIMRYDSRLGVYGGKPRPGGVRSTLCVSSQVGCKMGCTFCATGSMGFKNNLSSGEILEQLVHASRFAQIRNVVFMGMGEPLNNYLALVEAIQSMIIHPFQLSFKRITVSTARKESEQSLLPEMSPWDDLSSEFVSKIRSVLRIIKQNISLLCVVLTDKAQPLAVKEVMRASSEAFLMVLLAGGSTRVFSRKDHQLSDTF